MPRLIDADASADATLEFDRMLLRETLLLTRYARRLTRSFADAEDLVQDTLLRCWKARESFEPGSNIGGWTRTVMRNAFLSGLRRSRFEVDVPDDTVHRMQSIPPTQDIVVELHDTLRALDRLSDQHREAIEMAVSGVSVEEAAARLAVPLGTYKSRVSRGRAHLSKLVEEGEDESVRDRATKAPRAIPPVEKQRSIAKRRRDWSGVMIGSSQTPRLNV